MANCTSAQLVFGMCCFALLPVDSQAQDEASIPELSVPHIEGIVEELDVKYPPSPEESSASISRGAPIWSFSESRPRAKMVQLKLNKFTYDLNDFFRIDIIDHLGAVIQTLTAETLADRTWVWTHLSIGQSIGLYVYGNRRGALRFTIDQVSFDRQGRTIESIVGVDDREHLYKYNGEHLNSVEKIRGGVAKLSFLVNKEHSTTRETCTGFLISNDLLMTNQHCVADQQRCDTTKIIFGFTFDQAGHTPDTSEVDQYSCLKVEDVDHDHDMAVLRVEGNPGQRWGVLKFASTPPTEGQKIFILQHPAGEEKQISAIGCEVAEAISPGRVENTDFSHRCDTLGGSSGSPVLNQDGDIVGLHHWGRVDFGHYSRVNRAVRAEKILPLIAGLLPTGAGEPGPSNPDAELDSPAPAPGSEPDLAPSNSDTSTDVQGASTAAPS